LDRREILKSRKKVKPDDKVRDIFTYNNTNPPLKEWIRISKKALVKNEKAKGFKLDRDMEKVCRDSLVA
jgi:hypothetical protein